MFLVGRASAINIKPADKCKVRSKVPKSKSRKATAKSPAKKPRYGANIGRSSQRTNNLAGLGALVIVLGVVAFWWFTQQSANQQEAEVSSLSGAGQAALAQVQTHPNLGNDHLGLGETKEYDSPFPTSGDHAATAISPGFYARQLPDTGLVHSLEHGNIVFYYDAPEAAAIQQLKDWAALYDGPWDGFIATVSPGLGDAIVLTAWTKSLRLDQFDAPAAAAFIDAFRGRGPENPVR